MITTLNLFASTDSSDIAIVVGAFVTVVAGFLAVAKIMLSQASKDREADRQERKKLAEAIHLMAINSNKVAAATDRSANEAKERNGHLAELIVQQGENTRVLADKATKTVIEAVQHVNQQKVEHQIVKDIKVIEKG